MSNKIEILAPAGSYESLKAAISAGADAVYTGGSMFGARAFANNLTQDELLDAIDYVHLHGRKIYLTVNTLLKEQEIEKELYDYLLPYYKQGLDAVIVQDVGVLRFIKKNFPGMDIHASTQMTIAGVEGVKFLEEEGVERVVTSRELSLEEVRKITSTTHVEIESFVHGALCYCYSGQCLFSSFLGGRSGNRGQCAQPCRLAYKAEGDKKNSYLMSLKDICTLDLIPQMAEAGIYSFKIEGRMKKPEYVAAVTAIYRKYADLYLKLKNKCPKDMDFAEYAKKKYKVEEKDRMALMDLYNRGGFHTGYYQTRNGRNMISLDRPNHAGVPAVEVIAKQGRNVRAKVLTELHPKDVIELPMRKGREKPDNYTCKDRAKKGSEIKIPVFNDTPFQKGDIWNRTRNEELIGQIRSSIIEKKVKEKINGKLLLFTGCPAKLTVSYKGITEEVTGDEVQIAMNQPMDVERIEKQMKKTGNTPFEFGRLQIDMGEDVFVPMQMLNELRREALEKLEEKIVLSYHRMEPSVTEETRKEEGFEAAEPKVSASVMNLTQAKTVMKLKEIQRVYVDCVAFPRIWDQNETLEMIDEAHKNQKEIFLIMPYIFREDTAKRYEEGYEKIFGGAWDGILIRNYESYQFLMDHGYSGQIVTDYNMYQFNHYARDFWKKHKIREYTAPLELNSTELDHIEKEGLEVIIYGYLPMMVSAGCIQKTRGNCRKQSGVTTIVDRYHKSFMVKNECDYCYNVMYNYAPLYLGDKMDEVRNLGKISKRFMFTFETPDEIRKILKLYKEEQPFSDGEFTRGHWKRGIK